MNLVPYKTRNLKRFSPLSVIEDLQSDLNSFLDSSLLNLSNSDTAGYNTHWIPSTDIHDCGDHLLIKTDLAGVDKKDLDVSVSGNTLFIKGEKRQEDKVQDKGYIKSERFFGQFERALPLSNDVDASEIDATFRDGVLTVSIAKKEEAKSKQINVHIK